MVDVTPADALHESCHATVARLLGLPVISATAALPKPLVRTKHRVLDLPKIAQVDLAGLAVDSEPVAIEMDLANARKHVTQWVRLQHGLPLDGKVPPALEGETADLLERLRVSTEEMVKNNRPAIDRVAAVLMKGTTLTQQDVDAAILGGPEQANLIAARLAEAIQDFVSTLQQITIAGGPDHEDDFERALGVIERQQKLACDVLRKWGFRPEREDLN